MVWTDGRAVYGHVITKYSGMGRFTYPWCSAGALRAPELRSAIMNVAPRPWVGRSRVCFFFFTKIIFKLTIDISMCKIILEVEYFIKVWFFKRIAYFIPRLFHPEMIRRPLSWFKIQKNTGLLIFNFLKQKKLIFNFFVNRNWKKVTDSRKRAKILADNRKSHHLIETLV